MTMNGWESVKRYEFTPWRLCCVTEASCETLDLDVRSLPVSKLSNNNGEWRFVSRSKIDRDKLDDWWGPYSSWMTT